MFGFEENAQAGDLMSYSANVLDLYRRSAVYIDKILRGAKPADLPVIQPTKFPLINLKAANALSLTVPPTLLAAPPRSVMKWRRLIIRSPRRRGRAARAQQGESSIRKRITGFQYGGFALLRPRSAAA